MALEWADVDFVKNQVCVERSDWKGHVTSPKGGRLRYVPLTKALGAALRAHRHLRRRVLDERDGRPLTQKVLQCIVRAAARRAGLKHEGLHVLRHTFCSHLAMRSAPARAIQELAGHKDLSTTQRYMHLSPAATVNVIRLLDDAQTASSLETCWRRERNEELKAATAKGGLPAVARNWLSQPTFAKATVGSLRVISERRLVEAAGVETDGFDSAKWLMANVFWAKVLIRRRFHPFTLSTPFHSVRRDSTGVLETIWRRTPMATRERGKADGRTFGVQSGSHDD